MSEALEQQVDSGIDKLRAAGRNLWLAGLGSVAEVEVGGRQLFDRLVECGRPVEGKLEGTQKKLAETLTGTITGRASKAAREWGKRVEETVGFESRGVLKRLNLMTREDVEILTARLESLSKQIDEYAVRREAAAPKTKKTTKTVKAAAGKSGVKKG